jgi:hypothetical protein
VQQRSAKLGLLLEHIEVRRLVQRLESGGARLLVRMVHAADRERRRLLR